MMKRVPRHIHALMTSWMMGNISEEDALHLKQLIAENPRVKDAWREFRQQFSINDIQDDFNRYEQQAWIPAEVITAYVTTRRRRIYKRVQITVLAAALVAGVTIGVLIPLNHITETAQPLAKRTNSLPGNKKDIALQLANGQLLNLSNEKDKIVLPDARLNNAGKPLSYTLEEEKKNSELTAMNSLTVPVGKDYRVKLSDGTEVWLNAATTLQFPFRFNGKTREISVQGEAFLKVAKDARRPFLVHTQHGTVQVLGTSFNINDYDPAAVKVSLVEGAVCFKTGKRDVSLQPGQQVVYEGNRNIRLQEFDENDVLSWREGKFFFYDATLEEIVAVLPRWYGIRVVMDNPALGEERFTGMMDRNKPLDKFLQALSTTMKISYYVDHDILHLQ